ncbi:MAG TPA: fibronectin type III-like domain-contianing protein [Treponemataceae bacterium]|nr:fibronectin type III-like domain-contianing protein [Treponemataceae bacterium]
MQVYATDRVASIVTPVRTLKGFVQVTIPAGATVTASVQLSVSDLSIITPDERTVLEPGEFEIQAGHDSRSESLLTAVLTVE